MTSSPSTAAAAANERLSMRFFSVFAGRIFMGEESRPTADVADADAPDADDGVADDRPKAETSVQDLQAALFPVEQPRGGVTGGFLAGFLLKQGVAADSDASDEQLAASRESREQLPPLLFGGAVREPTTTSAQPPRWPTECQVLEERVRHISYQPPVPEPYYVPTGKEVQPKPCGDECGIIVYQYYPISAVNYFSRSSVGGSKYLLPTCPCPEEDTLRFESRFESGNLAKAIRVTANYYELHLRTDLYTSKHMQWFYFRVVNMRKGFAYRLSIVNLSKEDSLYNEGMRPLMYSTKDSLLHSVGWRRCGQNITYYSNESATPDEQEGQSSYTLSFTVEFPHDGDAVYLAHSYPYTYSDLQDYLIEMANHPIKSTYSTLRLLCKTVAGNNVYYVTVTSPTEPGPEAKKKRAIVVSARVHPGEAPSSWMMKGMLDFLTGDSGPAKELRDRFIFKIVPMLNPDGVIVGNNRCSLTGKDLNRQYRTVIRETYPSIWYTKLMVRRLLEECGVAMYCDLHAHSRKHNIFVYGCESKRGSEKRLQEQVFPLMLHKNAADKFSFESCKFRINKCKEGTGRVVMWMMGIANSYTMEASFGGSLIGTRAETHFSPQDYEQMGRTFCQTLLDFYDEDPRKERLRLKIISRLMKEGSNADEPTNIRLSDYSSDDGDTSSSSGDEDGDGDVGLARPASAMPVVPPPSPEVAKKLSRSRVAHAKGKAQPPRSPVASRKPLPLYRTTLGVDGLLQGATRRFADTSGTETESEREPPLSVPPPRRRKTRKRKPTKKALGKVKGEKSDSELQVSRGVSVLDLLPPVKLRSRSWHRTLERPPPLVKAKADPQKSTGLQLAEVQARLFTLKHHRVWMGVGSGDVDEPISWGASGFNVREPKSAPCDAHARLYGNKRESHKQAKKKSCKQDKCPRKRHKDEAAAAGERDRPQRRQQSGSLRRQTAVAEWVNPEDFQKQQQRVRRSKSMPQQQQDGVGAGATVARLKNDAQDVDGDGAKPKKGKKKKKEKRGATKKVDNQFLQLIMGKKD